MRAAIGLVLVAVLSVPAIGQGAPDVTDLVALRPGLPRAAIESLIADRDLDATALGKDLLIEKPLLSTVFEPQRTILRFDATGRLAAVHVQIEPDRGSSGAELLRLYGGVRTELVRALGRPAWERAEGLAAGDEIAYALSNGELVRYLQWELDGLTVRAGIPRRVDGRLYVEVLLSAERLPRHEEFWGLSGF